MLAANDVTGSPLPLPLHRVLPLRLSARTALFRVIPCRIDSHFRRLPCSEDTSSAFARGVTESSVLARSARI
jgi:hypothetical protein